MKAAILIASMLFVACASTPPPAAAPPPPVEDDRTPPPPPGPTRTSVKEIAKRLVGKCVGGGWIARWRSEGHMDVVRPKIFVSGFEDRTGLSIDTTYMASELESRMRLSGVYEMVSDQAGAHFLGNGKLLRLAELGKNGARVSVYTAVLDLVDPESKKTVQSCEATVEGEL